MVNDREISNAHGNIAFDKAISWDNVPGLAYKEIQELIVKDKVKYERYLEGIAGLFTTLFKGRS